MTGLVTVAVAVVALTASTMASANGPSGGYATSAAEYPLVAGQTMDAGKVYVWDVDGDIYVQLVANHDWCVTETHVAVDEIPVNNGGNPVPGQFPQGETFSECKALAGHYVFADDYAEGEGVDIAVHAKVRKTNTVVAGPSWATAVIASDQGVRKNGTSVLADRSTPSNALVKDYVSGGATTFFSLGFGYDYPDPTADEQPGSITVGFGCKVLNGSGPDLDLKIWEATNGTYPTERATVEISQDNTTWFTLGTADNSGSGSNRSDSFDAGALEWFKYVRLTEASNPADFESTADGFDVDGVEALQDCVEYQYESAWGGGRAPSPGKNWALKLEYRVGDGTVKRPDGAASSTSPSSCSTSAARRATLAAWHGSTGHSGTLSTRRA